jgi:PhzF family phenazine biosynthesis protein
MTLDLFQLDAFATRPFEGNPAAVMPLTRWLDDALLQGLAEENNLSETAFYTPLSPEDGDDTPAYHLRWFTPAIEVDLCGHATLATAAHLFEVDHPDATRLRFWTRSGWLSAERGTNGTVVLDFPAEVPAPVAPDPTVVAALGIPVADMLLATDLIAVTESAETVRGMTPDHTVISALDLRGIAVTAPSDLPGIDFVSRWFGARAGIREDPVTGSAHTQLAPYWAKRLGKDELTGRQLSRRGGTVHCLLAGDRVRLAGGTRRYLTGTVTLPAD